MRFEIPEGDGRLSWDDWQQRIAQLWVSFGSFGAHEEIRKALSRDLGLDLVQAVDFGISRRLARSAQRDLCYWNAARALLLDKDLKGGVYVEGLALHHVSHTGVGFRALHEMSIAWQGWLEVDGRVCDGTGLTVGAERYRQARVETAIYIPMARFGAAEVGDRWEELPLTLSDKEATERTVDTMRACLCAYVSQIERAMKRRGLG